MTEQFLLILLALHNKDDNRIARLCPSLSRFKLLLNRFLAEKLIRIEYKPDDQLIFLTDKGIDLLISNNLIIERKEAKILDYNFEDYIKAAFEASPTPNSYEFYKSDKIYRIIVKCQLIIFYLIYKYIFRKELNNAKTKKNP